MLEVEYSDEGGEEQLRGRLRRRAASSISIVYRDHDLVTPGDSDYVNRAC